MPDATTDFDHATPEVRGGIDHPPGLFFVAKAEAPYRIHLLERIASEISALKLHTFFTHSTLQGHDWNLDLPDAINVTRVAVGFESEGERWWKHPIRDHHKATRMTRYIRAHNIHAAIVYGYSTHSLRRVIHHCHGADIPCFYLSDSNDRSPPPKTIVHATVKRMLLPRVLRKCTGIFSMGELGDQYFDRWGGRGKPYYRVPNEPDYAVLERITEEQAARFREQNGLRADRRYMVFSGRIVPHKRLDLLLDAFAQCADKRPDWDVIVLGDGPQSATLKAAVPPALVDRVHWLGYRQMEEVWLTYRVADLLVLPSDFEPWALVVNEAMAAGMPVIASDICGAPWEMVRGQGCGRIFPKGDLEKILEAILDVTDVANYHRYRAAVAPALERWRSEADPIDGIRRALVDAAVIAED